MTSAPLEALGCASEDDFAAALAGIYEHSPWVAQRARAKRPFGSLAALKRALVEVVHEASPAEQLALLRAHPELAGKAMLAKTLTTESTGEQGAAGLAACSAEELATLHRLNAAYNAKFGFPFLLAVRGPRGAGLTRAQIIATFARRLEQHPDVELAEGLRNVHRVAELRLDDRFGFVPALGNAAWDHAERLAAHSDPGYAENGQLTVTYLTKAHHACAADLAEWMRDCGFDEVGIDAVGNVVGVYRGSATAKAEEAPRLLTGSHYD
ncbi:MAG: 2-oxo-4-hydroxy-4-carboxy-5-ureidoimidazoline decarboxylase, partial [Pseudomonadota bacterium]|nr:2-oxo-4-hydroxy-4-carboxy-5-ureidoimidazoline decarboxylase [Pseudomonadota bacterium]